MVARLARDNDQAKRSLVEHRQIERAQEEHGMANDELKQPRAAGGAFALEGQFRATIDLAAQTALGTATGGDRMRVALLQTATEHAPEAVSEPVGA